MTIKTIIAVARSKLLPDPQKHQKLDNRQEEAPPQLAQQHELGDTQSSTTIALWTAKPLLSSQSYLSLFTVQHERTSLILIQGIKTPRVLEGQTTKNSKSPIVSQNMCSIILDSSNQAILQIYNTLQCPLTSLHRNTSHTNRFQ